MLLLKKMLLLYHREGGIYNFHGVDDLGGLQEASVKNANIFIN